MIKNRRKIATRIIILIIILVAIPIGILEYKKITEPKLSEKNILIYTGYSRSLSIKGRVKSEKWYTDDADVVTVKDGKLTAVNPGSTKVYVDTGEKILSCDVEVREAKSPKYYEIAQTEKEWVLSQQLVNGALPNRFDATKSMSVNPYFACESMINVLGAGPDNADINQVLAYIEWHFSHLNTEDYNGLTGTIYDYRAKIEENTDGESVQETSGEKYDSTDSYSAMFLVLLDEYYKKTGDATVILKNEEKVIEVFNAMTSTLSGSYTNTKPDYKVAYLMDNVEFRQGLSASKDIFSKVINNQDILNNVETMIENFDTDFQNIWWKGDHFSSYVFLDDTSKTIDFDWSVFYADAVSQTYPVMCNAGTKEQQKSVYDCFSNNFDWQNLGFRTDDTSFYWGELSYAAVLMEDYEGAEKYIESYENEMESTNREYPLICGDASWVARGSFALAEYYRNIEERYGDKNY